MSDDMKEALHGLCCEKMAKETSGHQDFAGFGLMYPPGMRPDAQIEQDRDGTWNINGCCGGGCYVITEMLFCPFCGTALPGKEND